MVERARPRTFGVIPNSWCLCDWANSCRVTIGVNMKQKKFEIHGLEKALSNVPAEQRSSLVEEIVAELEDFDPEDAPGERVQQLPAGIRSCPACAGELLELGLFPNPNGGGVCILECEECDATYCEEPATLVQ